MFTETLIKNFIQEDYQKELMDKANEKTKEKTLNNSNLFGGIKEKFVRKNEEIKNRGNIIIEKNGKRYPAKKIESSNILDSNMKQIYLKGIELLSRDLKKSPIYIGDGKNILGVNSIERVYPEDEKEKKKEATLMVETDYAYFIISFPKVETF